MTLGLHGQFRFPIVCLTYLRLLEISIYFCCTPPLLPYRKAHILSLSLHPRTYAELPSSYRVPAQRIDGTCNAFLPDHRVPVTSHHIIRRKERNRNESNTKRPQDTWLKRISKGSKVPTLHPHQTLILPSPSPSPSERRLRGLEKVR